MAILDLSFALEDTLRTLSAGTGDQDSTDVFDAGAAKRVFGGHSQRPPRFSGYYRVTTFDTTATFRARFVGSDNAALDSNVEILADTGVQTLAEDGTVLVDEDVVKWDIPVVGQRTAKRYYGFIFTQGQANQVGVVSAVVGLDVQSNMVAAKAATP